MFGDILWAGLFVWLLVLMRRRAKRVGARLQEAEERLTRLAGALNDHAELIDALDRRVKALAAAPPSAAQQPVTAEAAPPRALEAGAVETPETPGAEASAAAFEVPETPGTEAAASAPAPGGEAAAEPGAVPGWQPVAPPPSAAAPRPVVPAWQPPVSSESPPAPDPVDAAFTFIRNLLFGGNTVVRVGIVVLLVGVVLLLRWAAEHDLFPIELRLIAVAATALGLAGFGYRERHEKPGFALTLQGGGIAALYLVVFFAFRSYGLLPGPLAFGLLLGIALCAGVLSVAQDSRSLIFIAQLFGFAAPLLASTGKGSHVGLFSYYLLLNASICGVAFFKAWRALNLLGFVFTFGVASTWGVLRYEPALFASTEPFVIAFFLLYLAIPIMFATRHPGTPRGWVDGSLIFGTPLAVLGLQWALVHDRPFGMAFSVLASGAVYLGLATWIKRRRIEQLATLGEAFLPIGVGFATLAIPYALDDHDLTAAAWAVEGAGLYWIGVRQSRVLARLAGVLLQLLAAGAVLAQHARPAAALPILNSWFLAGVLLAVSGLFIARYAYARRAQPRVRAGSDSAALEALRSTAVSEMESQGLQALIVWGLGFGLRASLGEIQASVSSELQRGVLLFALVATGILLELVGRRLDWLPGRVPALLLWPTMLVFLGLYESQPAQPLTRGGWLGWPLMAFGMVFVLRSFVETQLPQQRSLHALSVWLWTWWGVLLVERGLPLDRSFAAGAAGALIAIVLLVILKLTRGESWPFGAHKPSTLQVTLTGLAVYAALRGLGTVALPGSAQPLPYLPVINTIDIGVLLGLVATLAWLRRVRAADLCSAEQQFYGYGVLAALAFVWWNALLARSVHHYAGVPYDADELLESSALQLAFSLSWTLIALATMVIAHRTQLRTPWLVAAALLAIVVAKLFLLDLENLSTPTKIVSFLGVGALLLSVGYVAPVPPKAATPELQP